MKKILLTGSSGFIGCELLRQLSCKNYFIHTITRLKKSQQIKNSNSINNFQINEIDPNTDWQKTLDGVECIIHCAGLAAETNKIDTESYNKVNVYGTYSLANQAAQKGVKRFIFLSSIKVNGEKTDKTSFFYHSDTPDPKDIYAKSKWEAEQKLIALSHQTKLEVVIIRSPIVYGQGVKGNFFRLLGLVEKSYPLPFAGINNLRSFIALENLVDLIILCIEHPKAVGEIFLASDDSDISTPDLMRKLAKNMKKPSLLFKVPLSLIKFIGKIFRKSSEVDRLLSSLRVDCYHTKKILDWKPPVNLDKGLSNTVNWYLNRLKS